jgi:hypothetical protein
VLLLLLLQVISQVPAAGEVVVRELADMQGEVAAVPVVLLSQNLGGELSGLMWTLPLYPQEACSS